MPNTQNLGLDPDEALTIIQETCAHIDSYPPNFIADAATLPHPKLLVLEACRVLQRFGEELKVRDSNTFFTSECGHSVNQAQSLVSKLTSEWHDIDPEDKAVIDRINREPRPKLDHEVQSFMPVVRKYMKRALFGK